MLAQPKLANCITLLRSHTHSKALLLGHIVHDHIVKRGHQRIPFVATLILQFYLTCGALVDALQWLSYMPVRDVFSWNLVIGAFVHHGQSFEALQHYKHMQKDGIHADQVTYVHAISACTTMDEGVLVYEDIRASGFDCDTVVGTALVSMFGRHQNLQYVQEVFDNIASRNVISWNAIISAHTKNGQGLKATFFFNQSQQEGVLPDKVTIINMSSAHAGHMACVGECKKLHVYALYGDFMADNVVTTALIHTYGKCDHINEALMLFNEMENRGVVSWNAMITLYVQRGLSTNVFSMFYQMQVEGLLPDNVTFITLLDSCSWQRDLTHGKRLHLSVLHCEMRCDVILITSLINVYGKCGELQHAHSLFDKLNNRNVISWNAMITTYTQHGHGREALKLFYRMLDEAMVPNRFTFLEVFSACANQAVLTTGKKMHSCVVHSSIDINDEVGSTLISMYGKCGSVKDAQKLFDNLHSQKTSTWNALIATYAQLGYADKASQLFEKMDREGVLADDITFVSILASCSHGGLVDEGCHYFVSMQQIYKITATAEHYDCVIDLLCRAGLLKYASFLLNNMPNEPSIISWTSLICAYGIGIED